MVHRRTRRRGTRSEATGMKTTVGDFASSVFGCVSTTRPRLVVAAVDGIPSFETFCSVVVVGSGWSCVVVFVLYVRRNLPPCPFHHRRIV